MSPAISNENRSYCYDMNSTSIIFDLNVILLKTFHMFIETMTAVLVTSKSDPRTTAFELMFVFFCFFFDKHNPILQEIKPFTNRGCTISN